MANEVCDHGTVLYVIAPDENGPCKIGITQNIATRLTAIQVGCWLPLAVFAVRICFKRSGDGGSSMWSGMLSGAKFVETMAHRKLKELECHLQGEWFDVTPAEAVVAIEKVASESEAAAVSFEQVGGVEIPETGVSLERDTQAMILASLAEANAFARQSLDKIQ